MFSSPFPGQGEVAEVRQCVASNTDLYVISDWVWRKEGLYYPRIFQTLRFTYLHKSPTALPPPGLKLDLVVLAVLARFITSIVLPDAS